MGFSLVAATAVICVSLLLGIGIFLGKVLPTFSEIRESYDEMKDRTIDQVQTDINITQAAEVTAYSGTWWNNDWIHRKSITIDHTKVPEHLSNFPVLISVVDTDLKDKAQDDGDDILFSDSLRFQGAEICHNSQRTSKGFSSD